MYFFAEVVPKELFTTDLPTGRQGHGDTEQFNIDFQVSVSLCLRGKEE